MIITHANFVPCNGTELDKEDIVDRDGYRTTQQIVMEMIRAGERLEKFRRGEFDIEEEDDFDKTELGDPTREQGYDAADAFQDLKELEKDVNRYNKAVERAKKKKEEEIKKEEKKEVDNGNT